ncbi:asparagine synthase (glutamine-hydrolyzing) [Halarcobacter ebronensis]|uniref:asparagine synthase (glutamine-hydrolyzing) n=1 Tax=Halarcobacter ebronensis TaxID=1462615 RepID=A0A4Q1AV86_9BACT|nr:asparagine synthase (glutamine-hydrolyzing) [Halarcobacter ebronensis]QKF83301.1 asparagine synthase (glutamine-hydrolyzing, glutamine amidotransferase class-II domain) [Halarcobacter ebronensis]RXK05863.1 asparagine synthase (glutamine-hydrolyzing) [Halarcobacter ebronensis]
MCGIIGTNNKSVNFTKAVELLEHRGPDNLGYYEYKNNQFGHTRLSIIDLDKEANQPMEFDQLVITFNGEIYNYKELIESEKLHCVTKSDTEVLIRLYQKYGKDFLNKLNGMFSFCIYDKTKDSFFCARDRFGKKPFYYYHKDGIFIYASEIKSILKLLCTQPEMNMNAFYEYLSFMTPINTNTFYKDIKKLFAGSFLYKEGKEFITKKYYDIDNINTTVFDEEEALKRIEEILISSVKSRLVSDVEVATLLSGGVDSSLVSALYAKIGRKKINTFCIGYDEYEHYSELNYAKVVSKHIKSNHHELIMNSKDFVNTLDLVFNQMDEPFADSASIPTYLLSEFINKHGIKVALSGEGSDESFLGYDNYFKMLEYYDKKPQKEVFNLTKDWEYNFRALNKKHIYQTSGETFTEIQKEKLLLNYKASSYIDNYNCNYPPFKWLTYIDFKIWIEDVLMTKIDRMSMAHSLELRAPFLDYRLVEYVLSIDKSVKIGNTNKYLLKKIAEKYLPLEIVNRRKKGFSFPFIEWLHKELKDESLSTILKANKKLGLFDENFLKYIYTESKDGRFKQHFWSLYIFAKWFNQNY